MLVPDLIDSIVGFRTWVMTHDGLLSPMMYEQRPWPIERAHVANCFLGKAFGNGQVEPHDSPDIGCSCGIHSFNSFPRSWHKWAGNEEKIAKALVDSDVIQEGSIGSFVPGLVHSWGKVLEGDNGRRSEFAYPKALGFSPFWDTKKQKRVNQMAYMYGIESMPISELEEFSKQI